MQAPCIGACTLIAGPTLLILMALNSQRGWGGATLPFCRSRILRANVEPSLEHGRHAWFLLVGVTLAIASMATGSPGLC